MASISAKTVAFFPILIAISIPTTFTATVVEDLNNLQPPPDFNATITNNCRNNPSLRYCNSTPFNLVQIFKSTIVASHLCNISNNPNCVESFPKIDLRGRPKIAPLYLSLDFFWRYCPLTILSIDLSNNSLQGSFPQDVFYCSQIRSLDLSLNRLSGDVPLHKLSSLQNLTSLNLSYNAFSECRISETRFFDRFNSSSFLHSGLLPDHRELRLRMVAFLVGFPAAVIAAVVCFLWCCFWRGGGEGGHRFKAWVLEEASKGFSKRNLVGKCVYSGVLSDGREVRIEVYSEKMTREDRRRFVQKSELLVRLSHRNIVPVLGWCDSRRFMAVVTEWIDDGNNMETWIRTCVPPWKQRVQAISGIAAAVRYLHQQWPQIGYNLKARDVLLSQNGDPLITRFKFDDDHRSSAKRMCEFGVLVFETVTNRWDFGKRESGVVEWVKLHYPGNVEDLIDGRMEKTAEMVSAAAELVELGLICVDLSGRRQPSWEKFCDLLLNLSRAHRGRGHKHVHHRQH
ncbi:LRR receptor-like serine/threonine-protein kinase FLS2 [Salvia miltiorrhiza]|uniref:LRR receptor-like serine/threonine-protein kinase FLS2 n=1 Tax=Salvia miltiorrhiza TaxID=226208 RepID=UPI0025ACA715|nr:LRR receptor-like serine/threonine-protein kinase FLS2 [Salvia miltiorrhiza]